MESVSFHLKYWLNWPTPLLLARRMLSALPIDVMSKMQPGQLHSELFRCRHSTLQSHGLFAVAKPLCSTVSTYFAHRICSLQGCHHGNTWRPATWNSCLGSGVQNTVLLSQFWPSVCQMRVLWQNEIISVNISTPYEKGTSLVCRFHGGCWEFACFRNKNLSGTTYLAELYTQSGVDEITDCCVIRTHVGCRWIVMIVRWCSLTRINNSSGGITN